MANDNVTNYQRSNSNRDQAEIWDDLNENVHIFHNMPQDKKTVPNNVSHNQLQNNNISNGDEEKENLENEFSQKMFTGDAVPRDLNDDLSKANSETFNNSNETSDNKQNIDNLSRKEVNVENSLEKDSQKNDPNAALAEGSGSSITESVALRKQNDDSFEETSETFLESRDKTLQVSESSPDRHLLAPTLKENILPENEKIELEMSSSEKDIKLLEASEEGMIINRSAASTNSKHPMESLEHLEKRGESVVLDPSLKSDKLLPDSTSDKEEPNMSVASTAHVEPVEKLTQMSEKQASEQNSQPPSDVSVTVNQNQSPDSNLEKSDAVKIKEADDHENKNNDRTSDSEISDDFDNESAKLIQNAIRGFSQKCHYYDALINETVSELSRSLKKARVDQLIVLLDEASDEMQLYKTFCATITKSLLILVPSINQALEILNYQVRTDTEHLVSLDTQRSTASKEPLSTTNKLFDSIEQIEVQLRHVNIPEKIKRVLKNAKRLGESLSVFLNESKETKNLFKEVNSEALAADIIHKLALSSTRAVVDTNDEVQYNLKLNAEQIKETEIQTSREATKLKSLLLEKTKTNIALKEQNLKPSKPNKNKAKPANENPSKKAKDTKQKPPAKSKNNAPKKEKNKKTDEKSSEVQINESKSSAVEEKTKEEIEAERIEKLNIERQKELEEKERVIREFKEKVETFRISYDQNNDRILQIYVTNKNCLASVETSLKIFGLFPVLDRQLLDDYAEFSANVALRRSKEAEHFYQSAVTENGNFLEVIETALLEESEPKMLEFLEELEKSQILADEVVKIAENALLEVEQQLNNFLRIKSIWEKEIPISVIHKTKETSTAIQDLNYRIDMNRRELVKISAYLFTGANEHEWSETLEIKMLAAPAREVSAICSALDKIQRSAEEFCKQIKSIIDSLLRSDWEQKLSYLEELDQQNIEGEEIMKLLRINLNNIQKVIFESKENIQILLDDPSRKWRPILLPNEENQPVVAVVRAPANYLPLNLKCQIRSSWEKNALLENEVLVSEIVCISSINSLPGSVLVGISHGGVLREDPFAEVVLKTTLDGRHWHDIETRGNPYKMFNSANGSSQLNGLFFAETKARKFSLGYCVVVRYSQNNAIKDFKSNIWINSRLFFKEGGTITAGQHNSAKVIVPKGACNCSAITIKTITPCKALLSKLKEQFADISSLSSLYKITSSHLLSPSTKLKLMMPYPHQHYDQRRFSLENLIFFGFDEFDEQWVQLDTKSCQINYETLEIDFSPRHISKILVANGHCEDALSVPKTFEQILRTLPRKPFRDDDVLDDSCLRHITDKLMMGFDRFGAKLGIPHIQKNKSGVQSKLSQPEQKFQLLQKWRKKNIDRGDKAARLNAALTDENVGRYDIADWLNTLIVESRAEYEQSRQSYSPWETPQITERNESKRVAVLSPNPKITESKIKPNSRGLSDISTHIESQLSPRMAENEDLPLDTDVDHQRVSPEDLHENVKSSEEMEATSLKESLPPEAAIINDEDESSKSPISLEDKVEIENIENSGKTTNNDPPANILNEKKLDSEQNFIGLEDE